MKGTGEAQTDQTRQLRVMVIAEAANPELVSVPLVGWSLARALAGVCEAHLVTQVRNREGVLRAGLIDGREVTFIDSERVAGPVYRAASALRGGSNRGWTLMTAASSIGYAYFERMIWRRFGEEIRAGAWDLVHRVTPLSPTTPSSLSARCARAGVPFVLGPLNGGVAWPAGFDRARRREREWLSYVRGAYRLVPGYRSTRRHASAIIVGSRDTLAQMPVWCRDKCVYIVENAVDPSKFGGHAVRTSPPPPVRVAFLGRLVPYKGADMLIEAAAALVRAGALTIDIIGDGPERAALEALCLRERLGAGVSFAGWLEHARVRERLQAAHVLGFPSIREFGGGVALEAMALGVVPVVMDYAGPAELVTPGTGWLVPMGPRESIIAGFRRVLEDIVERPEQLPAKASAARERVREWFTWEAKARQVERVYRWVRGEAPKPDFGTPMGTGPFASMTAQAI